MSALTFLIPAANSKQGQATARALLRTGAGVHGLVRNPSSEAAQRLETDGAKIFTYRDFHDFEAVRAAARGCRGLFLNLMPMPDAGEQCAGIVQAAKDAGVDFVVITTAYFTSRPDKWDERPENGRDESLVWYFNINAATERVVRESGLRYTILRPSWIHFNYVPPVGGVVYPELAARGELAVPHDVATVRMSHIDNEDIAAFAAAALLDPDRFAGEEIELGNENLAAEEVRAIISKVTGCEIAVRQMTSEEIEAARDTNPPQCFQLWSSRVDVSIDGQALQRKYGIRLTSFEEFVQREKDTFLAILPAKN